MPSSLIEIGKSGAIAARTALETTAQNIANAENPNYARRSVALTDVTATGNMAFYNSGTLSGVKVSEVLRSDSVFLQNQARRTQGELARADAELAGLRNGENAIEQAGIFPTIVEFEAALGGLRSDPLNPALHASVAENGRTLASTIRIADASLNDAGGQIRLQAGNGVDQVNLASAELAQINAAIVRTEPGTSARATLLDQRDTQLDTIAQQTGIAVEYQGNGTVNVRLNDGSGPFLVQGVSNGTLSQSENPDGTVDYALDGTAISLATGELAGHNQALVALRDLGSELDALAQQAIGLVNASQTNGTTPDGTPGQPFFSGDDAGDIAVVIPSGTAIATAPAGASAGSLDTGNLDALRSALANNGPASEANRILFNTAGAINGREIGRDALAAIAETAQLTLQRETGVDLDQEAANLIRYQQAFQASGRVIEVANTLFDTILGIR